MTHDTPDTPTIQIPLTKGFVAIIDAIDADLLCFKWHINGRYASRNFGGRKTQKEQSLHRAVMEKMLGRVLLTEECVDHIDRDRMNCRRSNLRIATPSQNRMNQGISISNSSGYKGVSWHKPRQRWTAAINFNGKYKTLGRFKDILDAARAYNEAALKYHGEFAYINPIPDSE